MIDYSRYELVEQWDDGVPQAYPNGLPEPPMTREQRVAQERERLASGWYSPEQRLARANAALAEIEREREIREADASTARIASAEDKDYALELALREDAERREADEQPPDGCGACGETPAYYYAAYPDSGRLCDNHATLEAEGRAREGGWG